MKPPVEVTFHKDAKRNQFCFRVKVRSIIRPGLCASRYVYPGADGLYSPKDVKRAIAVGGGAAAEHLDAQYGDTLDPVQVAKDSIESYLALLTRL